MKEDGCAADSKWMGSGSIAKRTIGRNGSGRKKGEAAAALEKNKRSEWSQP